MNIKLHLDLLPYSHRTVWSEFCALNDMGLVLYGGTAVALQLGHRQAQGFTFYASRPFEPDELANTMHCLQDCTCEVCKPSRVIAITKGGVRMVFTGLQLFGRVGEPVISADNGLQVASLQDLMAQKLHAILERRVAEDYMDLAAMAGCGLSVTAGLGDAMAIYGTDFKPMAALKALSRFECDKEVPRHVRYVLAEAARKVDLIKAGTVLSYNLQRDA